MKNSSNVMGIIPVRLYPLIFLWITLASWQKNFAQETVNGIVWFPPALLSDSSYDSVDPKIALTGDDTVHVTWRGDADIHRLPYIRSLTNGRSWEPQGDLITDTTEFPVGYVNATIITEGQHVYLFANNEWGTPKYGDLKRKNVIAKSTTGGTTWEPLKRIGPDSAAGMWSASVHEGTLVIVYGAWRNGFGAEVREIYSIDGGATWTRTNDTLDSWTRTVIVGNTLHLVRETSISNAVEKLYLRSTDLGNSFPYSEILSNIDGRNSFEHDLAANVSGSDSTMILVWRETRLGCIGGFGCSIALRESHDYGNTWTPEEIISEQLGGVEPSVALGGGKTAVTWVEEDQSGTTYSTVVRIRDSSGVWLPTFYVGGSGSFPDVAISRSTVHVVYVEQIGGSLGTYRVFYRRGVFEPYAKPVSYDMGWNLVSLPHKNSTITYLPALFAYESSYVKTDTMQLGRGYWAKPDSQIVFEGEPVYSDTIMVNQGWNIIGALSVPIGTGTIQSVPSGIITSSFFGYKPTGYFTADTLYPGRGYWVKVSQNGKLILMAN